VRTTKEDNEGNVNSLATELSRGERLLFMSLVCSCGEGLEVEMVFDVFDCFSAYHVTSIINVSTEVPPLYVKTSDMNTSLAV
jgi:hypothetical protein